MVYSKVLVPSGVLGLGFDFKALKLGILKKPDIISIDGGSTDSGPASLGSGTSKYSRAAIKSEWKILMQARSEAKIPLIVGSCGTCGTNGMVDWMEEITHELSKELGQSLKITKLFCEQEKEFIKKKFKSNKIYPLDPAPELNLKTIDEMSNIVALAGAEQIQEATIFQILVPFIVLACSAILCKCKIYKQPDREGQPQPLHQQAHQIFRLGSF